MAGDRRLTTAGGGQKTEDRERTTKEGAPKAEDRKQEAVSPNKGTCSFCAYAHWMRLGLLFQAATDWLPHLICVNHPEAPGELQEVMSHGTCPNFRARREPPLRVPPPEPPNDQVKFIALTKGQHAIVDAADFEWLNQHKWYAVPNTNGPGYYAARGAGGRTIFMHRQIMNAPDDMVVDHANHCPSDNRRCNLRLCTPRQNAFNRRTTVHSSRYQGVTYNKDWGKWVARIKLDGINERLGGYDDEIEAARVRDRWAFAFHGRFAYLNFPEDFAGKDPSDPEFQALRDQLAEKRRKREETKKEKGKSEKAKGKSKRAKGKGKRSNLKHRDRRGDKAEGTNEK